MKYQNCIYVLACLLPSYTYFVDCNNFHCDFNLNIFSSYVTQSVLYECCRGAQCASGDNEPEHEYTVFVFFSFF